MRPVVDERLMKIEILNEYFCLLCISMFLQFSDINSNIEIREALGWNFILFVGLILVVNTLLILWVTLKETWISIKERCNRKKA